MQSWASLWKLDRPGHLSRPPPSLYPIATALVQAFILSLANSILVYPVRMFFQKCSSDCVTPLLKSLCLKQDANLLPISTCRHVGMCSGRSTRWYSFSFFLFLNGNSWLHFTPSHHLTRLSHYYWSQPFGICVFTTFGIKAKYPS